MKSIWRETLTHWLQGIRIYVAFAIILLSLGTLGWAATNFSGTSLFSIRLTEAYAWLAVVFLLSAVSIGPVCSIFKNLPGRNIAYDARRMLGIGAAWFSTLHVSIAYVSLFSFANPLTIPGVYGRAFVVGSIAWLILLAMAFTSFNAAMARMGKWWYRLHRFVYIAVLSVMLHAFMIGTHASRGSIVVSLGVITSTLLVMHSFVIVKQGKPVTRWQLAAIGGITAALVIVLSFGYSHRSSHQVSTAIVGKGGSNVQAY